MRRAGRVSQDPGRDSISASTIAVVMVPIVTMVLIVTVVAAAIIMIAVSSLPTIAVITTAALVDHRRRSVITGRFVDYRRRLSPTKRVDINPDMPVRVRGACRHRQRDDEK
jgi:hypothetical protein